jgi:hypothetical protein
MAMKEDAPKYIRIPVNFFNLPEIKELSSYPEADKLIIAYFKLLIFIAKLDNDGKLQVKHLVSKKVNIFFPRNEFYPKSLANIMGLDIEPERTAEAVEIFLKCGLIGANNNPKEPYFYIKDWGRYKFLKPGKKTEWTKEKVEEVLKENDYNISKAARTVGIAKQYISFLAKKFGIEKPRK